MPEAVGKSFGMDNKFDTKTIYYDSNSIYPIPGKNSVCVDFKPQSTVAFVTYFPVIFKYANMVGISDGEHRT